MRGVQRINPLYGYQEIDRLQRKNGGSLMNLRATREEIGGKVESNTVWSYGHVTIPF